MEGSVLVTAWLFIKPRVASVHKVLLPYATKSHWNWCGRELTANHVLVYQPMEIRLVGKYIARALKRLEVYYHVEALGIEPADRT